MNQLARKILQYVGTQRLLKWCRSGYSRCLGENDAGWLILNRFGKQEPLCGLCVADWAEANGVTNDELDAIADADCEAYLKKEIKSV